MSDETPSDKAKRARERVDAAEKAQAALDAILPMPSVVGSNGRVEMIAQHRFSNRKVELVHHARLLFDDRAGMARELVGRWGMVAGADGGEDSTGRAKLRLMTPAEVVARAVETASIFADEIERLGWFVSLPSYADLDADDPDK